MTPNEIYSLTDHTIQLVDTRPTEQFAESHIPGSIHLPLVPNFIPYAKAVLNPAHPIILILQDESHFSHIEKLLKTSGFDGSLSYLKGGFANWQYPTETLPTISATQLENILAEPNTTLIDVRTHAEFNAEKIAQAIHYPLGKFDAEKLNAIPNQNQIYLICAGGTRSSIMASILKRNGRTQVHNVHGGMSAWTKRNL